MDIVEDQCWGIDELKSMADRSSSAYESAMENGIPDGIARSFKEELSVFKKVYHEERAAAALTDIRYGPGGFMR